MCAPRGACVKHAHLHGPHCRTLTLRARVWRVVMELAPWTVQDEALGRPDAAASSWEQPAERSAHRLRLGGRAAHASDALHRAGGVFVPAPALEPSPAHHAHAIVWEAPGHKDWQRETTPDELLWPEPVTTLETGGTSSSTPFGIAAASSSHGAAERSAARRGDHPDPNASWAEPGFALARRDLRSPPTPTPTPTEQPSFTHDEENPVTQALSLPPAAPAKREQDVDIHQPWVVEGAGGSGAGSVASRRPWTMDPRTSGEAAAAAGAARAPSYVGDQAAWSGMAAAPADAGAEQVLPAAPKPTGGAASSKKRRRPSQTGAAKPTSR